MHFSQKLSCKKLLIFKTFSFSDAATVFLARTAKNALAIVCRPGRLAHILLPTTEKLRPVRPTVALDPPSR